MFHAYPADVANVNTAGIVEIVLIPSTTVWRYLSEKKIDKNRMEEQNNATKRRIEYPRMHSVDQPCVQNPFFHRLHFNILDVLKMVVMSITIAPLRLLLASLILLMIWPLAALGNACRSSEDRKKPLTGWRKGYGRILRFALRTVFFLFGFHWIKMKGKRSTSKEAPIVCAAPHSSFFDALVVLMDTDLGSGVSREANGNIPLVGHMIHFAQPVFVSREDPNSRQTTIDEIKRRSQSGGQWPQMFIFPEGTCSNRSCLITFKGGAFIPGVPVQPLCIRYPNRLDTMTWTMDGPGMFKLLWCTLCQFHNYIEVEFLPVYRPSEQEINDPRLFANNVRQKMADCLALPVTDHTYDDCRLMMRAGSLQLPMETGLVEFQKLHRKLGFSYDQMNKLLKKFHTIDRSGTGNITIQEFAEYLHLPVSPALEEVFLLYDRDQSGCIDFREYVIGLSLIAHPANTEDTLQRAFQLFDQNNKGYISQSELEMILCTAFTMEPDESRELFQHADTDKDGKITYEDFRAYAEEKPEYASLFVTYHNNPLSPSSSPSTQLNVNKISVSPAVESSNTRSRHGREGSENKNDDDHPAVDGKLKAQ